MQTFNRGFSPTIPGKTRICGKGHIDLITYVPFPMANEVLDQAMLGVGIGKVFGSIQITAGMVVQTSSDDLQVVTRAKIQGDVPVSRETVVAFIEFCDGVIRIDHDVKSTRLFELKLTVKYISALSLVAWLMVMVALPLALVLYQTLLARMYRRTGTLLRLDRPPGASC
jgi:hypothetical protein